MKSYVRCHLGFQGGDLRKQGALQGARLRVRASHYTPLFGYVFVFGNK
jgi:hypothetical protein